MMRLKETIVKIIMMDIKQTVMSSKGYHNVVNVYQWGTRMPSHQVEVFRSEVRGIDITFFKVIINYFLSFWSHLFQCFLSGKIGRCLNQIESSRKLIEFTLRIEKRMKNEIRSSNLTVLTGAIKELMLNLVKQFQVN